MILGIWKEGQGHELTIIGRFTAEVIDIMAKQSLVHDEVGPTSRRHSSNFQQRPTHMFLNHKPARLLSSKSRKKERPKSERIFPANANPAPQLHKPEAMELADHIDVLFLKMTWSYLDVHSHSSFGVLPG